MRILQKDFQDSLIPLPHSAAQKKKEKTRRDPRCKYLTSVRAKSSNTYLVRKKVFGKQTHHDMHSFMKKTPKNSFPNWGFFDYGIFCVLKENGGEGRRLGGVCGVGCRWVVQRLWLCRWYCIVGAIPLL